MAAEGTPELFSPGSSWGDSDMPEETLTLPQALHFLEERGVGFNLVGRYLGSGTTTVKKNLSVYFAVDTVVSSQDIIEGFDAAGTRCWRDKISSTISNGIRSARVRLGKPIPSAAYIAGEVVYFFYASQPRTCRRCGFEGHMARSCSAVRCYSCEKPGHRSSECEEPRRCSVCLESSHDLAGCPFVFYSANVAPPVPGAATYAAIVDQRSDPTDPPPPPLGANRPRGLGNRFKRRSY